MIGNMIGQMEASSEPAVEDSEASLLQPTMVTVATQTDEYDNDDDDDAYYIDLQSCAEPGIYEEPNLSGEVFHPSDDLHLAEMDLDIGPDFEDDFGRTVDFEYKEVTIFRTNADQKIGLTLCYGSAADEITDIYVSEVDPHGIAGIDGRIREGDQILQINGFDVHTRQQAVRMFAESGATISLLLARSSAQLGNGSLNDHNDEMPLADGPPLSGLGNSGLLVEENCEEFGLRSAYGDVTGRHPDVSDRNARVSVDEASGCVGLESKISVLNDEMKRIRLQYQEIVAASDLMRSPRLVPRMGTRLDQIRQSHGASDPAEPQWARNEPLARASRRHPDEQQQIKTSPKRSHQRRSASAEQGTSAYNSCHGASPPVTDRAEEFDAMHRMVCKPSHSDLEQTTSGPYPDGAQKEWSSDGDGRLPNPANNLSHTTQTHPEKNVESLQMLYNQYIEVMYTNKANLQHTIMVQQNLFQQQLARHNSARLKVRAEQPPSPKSLSKHHALDSAECAASQSPAVSAAGHHPNSVQPVSVATGSDIQMEWVVKRRADGSRYITRRPIRNRILKERARKLAEERCGLTTDDDAISELKVGRYWSKEERKRHLEKARDHRRQKEILLRQQMEGAKENYEAKKEGNVLELSHRKNVRHKGKKTSDDLPPTTVPESASQRSHDTHGKTYNPLLSVTTV